MNLKTVTIADLKPHPQNPNTHPPKQIDELAKSLTKFTQVKNVVIWNDRIIAGHGVIEAAKKAGILTLEAQDISHWPEDKATEFMLADIRLPDMGAYDEAALVEVLRYIDQPVDIPGFDEDFLKGLRIDENWRDDIDFQEYDESVENEVKYIECPHCGEKFPK
jgi:ParB-like chromosome segregation protein Spo0J